MLAGWLERGLDPKQIVVQDPSPPPRAKELIQKHGIDLRRSRRLAARATGRAGGGRQAADAWTRCSRRWRSCRGRARSSCRSPPAAASTASSGTCRKARRWCAACPIRRASIGRGITGAVGNAHVTPAKRDTCDALLRAVGEVVWVDEEGLLDAVTAVSGSGPAYVFYLAECLAEAGVKAGLPPELAHKLARWTVSGAGELLHRSDLPPDLLRQNVTSPNGTTFAALQVLMADERAGQADARGGGSRHAALARAGPVAGRAQ